MESIVIQTKTTAQDYKKLVFFNTFLKKKLMVFLMPIGAVISLAAVIGKSIGKVEISDWYYYVCLSFLWLLVLLYVVFIFSVKRFLASDRIIIDDEITVTINETGVMQEGRKAKSAGEFQWDMFYQSYETKHYFYLYINTLQAIILPKRDFSGTEIAAVEKLIKEKLGRRFIKR
ncbi:MAG: YcxB family protein [Bacillota bacterium]